MSDIHLTDDGRIDHTWLDEAACWERLRGQGLGRLGYHLVDEVHIAPVNYAVDGTRLVFRTTPGSKLLGLVMDSDVAFQIDGLDGPGRAWSVLARGRARILEGEEKRAAEQLPVHPWAEGEKLVLVAIEVSTVTGRELDVARPDRA